MQSEVKQAFFDQTDFPWLPGLAEDLPALRQEAEGVISGYRYLRWRYPDLYDSTKKGIQGQRATFYLQIYGMPITANRALCPRAAAAADRVPGLVTSAIYLLDAHSRILPHVGATNLVLRGHMGLICPPGCFLRVGEEKRSWGEGDFIVFDDTIEHEAWNETDQIRAILLFDFFPRAYEPALREQHLEALRSQYLGPLDYLWLKAADTPCQADVPKASVDSLKEIVAGQGLYFP